VLVLNSCCVLLLFPSALTGFVEFLLALRVLLSLVLDAAFIVLGSILLLSGFGGKKFCVAASVQVSRALQFVVRVAFVSVRIKARLLQRLPHRNTRVAREVHCGFDGVEKTCVLVRADFLESLLDLL